MDSLGYGIIGCGRISVQHIEALSALAGVRVVAVADPKEEKARRAAASIPEGAQVYTDYHHLLAHPEVHVAVICAPTHLHRDVTVEAAAAGKHVYCEKAIAHTLAAARQMMAARDRYGIKLMIGQSTRFRAQYMMARRLIAEGAIGQPFAVEGRFTGHVTTPAMGATDSWRYQAASAGNGHVINFGCHYVDTARFLSGCEPERVLAWVDNFFSSGMAPEDQFAVISPCGRGAVITIVMYSNPPNVSAPGDGYTIHGTEGCLEVGQGSAGVTVARPGGAPELIPPDEALRAEGAFTRIHRLFAECVRHNTPEPVTAEDAARNLEWGLAAYLSQERGGWVELPLGPEYADYAGPQLERDLPATRW